MGASGSKAAVHKAASKAAAAAPKPPPPPAAAAAEKVASSLAGPPKEVARQPDPLAMPARNREENEGLVNSMNKLMAGVQQYQYEIYRNPEVDKLYAMKKKSKEEKEAELVGRLSTTAFKQLMEEHAMALRHGKQLSAAELARRYGANEEVLEKVLQHNAVPFVHEAEDGRLVGTWPRGRGD